MSMRFFTALFTLAAILIAMGCSMSSVWPGPSSNGGGGSDGSGTAPSPASRPSAPQQVRGERFLGHLAVKGMRNEQRNLMTSIVIHPKLWEREPYVLFDQNGFGETYIHKSPMGINTRAIRAEAEHDANSAAAFWGGRSVHVMMNTEGWPLQWHAASRAARSGASPRAYNQQALRVYRSIQQGVEAGWPAIDRFGWWSRIITPGVVRKRNSPVDADRLNLEAASVWRRASYFAGHVYPMQRLVPDHQRPGVDQAHADDWVVPVYEAVEAMLRLRDSLGGDQFVLPCIFGTSMGWSGTYKDQWLTEQERRLLVRACAEAGADGVMVWQPIRSERERDEFQRAITQIEAELARINGDRDLGPSMSLGEMFRIGRDWPGRPMDWMRRRGDQTLQPSQTR